MLNLHRASEKPEWDLTRKGKHGLWQRIARATYGIVTPGNLTTIAGFCLVLAGLAMLLRQEYLPGAIMLAIGRLADVADGWLADITATKSPLGEVLDAGLDKIATFLMIATLFAAQIVSWPVLVIILLPHAYIAVITIVETSRGKRSHPSFIGKLSMATLWVCLVGFVAAKAFPEAMFVLTFINYVVAAVSVLLGVRAAIGYTKSFKQ